MNGLELVWFGVLGVLGLFVIGICIYTFIKETIRKKDKDD